MNWCSAKSVAGAVVLALHFLIMSDASAVPAGVTIIYPGKGAGPVVFDGTLHAQKGLACAACHEGRGLAPALFDMQRSANSISMRKIYFGRSCGHCHKLTNRDFFTCSICHHK